MNDTTPPSLSSSGMSETGTETDVSINQPRLAPHDKQVLCSAMCFCQSTPNQAVNGKSLKQTCVAQRLGELNEILQGQSPYRPEVSYDMTKNPPAPILNSQDGISGHSWLPGWIRKYWDADPEHPPFEPGTGMIRRPDVVIVNNPSGPPTQDNIKQVVEMKFPPDVVRKEQVDDYGVIAGSRRKVVVMEPEDCDCSNPEPAGSTVPVEELGWAAGIAAALIFLLSKGKTRPPLPRPVPAY